MTPRESIELLQEQMNRAILGQEQVVERLLLTLLCNGNALLEGLPGLAKTRAVRCLADHLDADLSRIQFTPDLLPSDITGSEIYLGEETAERFSFQPGPLFSNLVLADEINRAPAKVQAALLEAMEERQVTVAGTTHRMPDLFMVLATQNPVEQEGTYPLPEAQMDRFLMHVLIDYPPNEVERQVVRLVRRETAAARAPAGNDRGSSLTTDSPPRVPQDAVFLARDEIAAVTTPDYVEQYLVDLVTATRRPASYGDLLGGWIQVGVSPRGSLALDRASRAHAWLADRTEVTPDNVRAVVQDCLRHRLILSYEAGADGISADQVIEELLSQVAVG